MLSFVDKVLHFGEGRKFKVLQGLVAQVNALEDSVDRSVRRGSGRQDGRIQATLGTRREPGRAHAGGLRRGS